MITKIFFIMFKRFLFLCYKFTSIFHEFDYDSVLKDYDFV